MAVNGSDALGGAAHSVQCQGDHGCAESLERFIVFHHCNGFVPIPKRLGSGRHAIEEPLGFPVAQEVSRQPTGIVTDTH